MIVYKIVNNINGKIYIGQTVTKLKYRWTKHCSDRNNCTLLDYAIKKYGKENFTILEIDNATSLDELNKKESEWIEKLKSYDRKNGYNLMRGGDNRRHTLETKAKMSIASKRNNARPEIKLKMSKRMSGKNNPMYGVSLVPSAETRKKISLKTSGKNNPMYGVRLKKSDEFKRNRSDIMKSEKNPMKGKTHTLETREKMKLSWAKRRLEKGVINDSFK